MGWDMEVGWGQRDGLGTWGWAGDMEMGWDMEMCL